ncbi:hypothetical protein ACHWQZ_G011805 [Mnemiopsis leidyi]
MKESLIPEGGDYNAEPSCAFQSNESNRLSLRRLVSSSTIGYDCSAQKRSSSVSCYSLSLCYSDIPLLFFLMKCFGSCIIFGDEDCSAGPQEEIPVDICNSLLHFGFIYYFAFLFTPESEK